MKFLILALLFVSLVAVQSQRCLVQERDRDGNPARCGGFAGASCPSRTNTCRYYPGADYGPCCLGCRGGNGPRRRCLSSRQCRRGYCVKPVNRPWGIGVCCRRRRRG